MQSSPKAEIPVGFLGKQFFTEFLLCNHLGETGGDPRGIAVYPCSEPFSAAGFSPRDPTWNVLGRNFATEHYVDTLDDGISLERNNFDCRIAVQERQSKTFLLPGFLGPVRPRHTKRVTEFLLITPGFYPVVVLPMNRAITQPGLELTPFPRRPTQVPSTFALENRSNRFEKPLLHRSRRYLFLPQNVLTASVEQGQQMRASARTSPSPLAPIISRGSGSTRHHRLNGVTYSLHDTTFATKEPTERPKTAILWA